jgi:hypothetical protein
MIQRKMMSSEEEFEFWEGKEVGGSQTLSWAGAFS